MSVIVSESRLREVLSYCPTTGHFMWLKRLSKNVPAGRTAGAVCQGYLRIKVDGKLFAAHRLAWLFVYGVWPAQELDHIDCDRANNRIANLRLASSSQNKANTAPKRTNTSGYKGVRFHSQRRRWNARITVAGQQVSLGMFDDAEEAHLAYVAAAQEYFGSFARGS
jgi:hypothetical protein